MKIPNFIDELDQVLLAEQADKKIKYANSGYRHYPSSATLKRPNGEVVGACLRQLYYRAKKVPESEPMDTTGLIQAGFGDAIHGWLLNKFSQSPNFRLMKETGGKFIYDPLTREISYRLDGIVSVDDHMGGLEIKTTQGRALTGKGWGVKDKGPKEDHLLQVLCYMSAQPSLKWFALVYFARDSAYRIQFNITREDDRFFCDGVEIKDLNFSGIVQRWEELECYIERDEVPPRDYKVYLKADGSIQDVKTVKGVLYKSDFRCLYCSHSNFCWSQPDAKNDAYK